LIDWLTETFSNPYVLIVIFTLVPALELRWSIPYGILVAGIDWWWVVPLAIVTNIVLGPIVYVFLDKFLHIMLRIGWFNRLWERFVLPKQKKIHAKVEKYGVWGLSLFIGVPLPGSGVYSGGIGGYLLGFSFREFFVSTVLGVLIAGAAVTAVVLSGSQLFDFMIKHAS
jgi:uncharacterized membrane protein